MANESTTSEHLILVGSEGADDVSGVLVRQPQPWWKVAPVDGRGLALVVSAYLGLAAALVGVGWMIVSWWDGTAMGERDADVNRWFADRRTPTRDGLAELGSALSDTTTMVLLGLALLPVCLLLYRRWHDWMLIVGALVLEVTTFATASMVVGRERPPVEQLDSAPTASFPSGHIAAATVVYVGLWWIVSAHTEDRRMRWIFGLAGVAVPAAVVISRLYRGMHYPTDALGGILLGLACLVVVRRAIERTTSRAGAVLPGFPDGP